MTIYYLYVKTHKITGLKYLGYTGKADPYKYLGSGEYWLKHLSTHGKEVTTEILHECQSKDEVKERGLYYSSLWNVVTSRDEHGKKIWANLKPEEGDGGCIGYPLSPESIAKQKETKKRNGSNSNTPDSSAKRVATRLTNSTFNNNPKVKEKIRETRLRNNSNANTPDSIAKRLATKHTNKSGHYQRIICPHCGVESGKPNYVRHHGDKCKNKN